MKPDDTNIRIYKSTHRKLRILAARMGMSIKNTVDLLSNLSPVKK